MRSYQFRCTMCIRMLTSETIYAGDSMQGYHDMIDG